MFLFSQQRSIIFRLLFLRIRANVRLTARPRVALRHFTISIRARVSLRFRFARDTRQTRGTKLPVVNNR